MDELNADIKADLRKIKDNLPPYLMMGKLTSLS